MTFCYTFTPIFIIYIDYIMRKVVLTLVTLVFVSFVYAQDVTFDSFKRIESDKVLNLSADPKNFVEVYDYCRRRKWNT